MAPLPSVPAEPCFQATEKNGMTLGRNPLRINMAHDKNERLKAVQKKCHLKVRPTPPLAPATPLPPSRR